MPWQAGQSGNPATRFRPGRSGNPRGRPPVPSITPRLRQCLEREAGDGATVADLVVEAIVRRALAGDIQAIRLIFDRVEGKAPDRVAGAEERSPVVVRMIRSDHEESGFDGPTDEV